VLKFFTVQVGFVLTASKFSRAVGSNETKCAGV
jgi:hypothetical protein